mmetsp:Transcript_23280/g.45194  ORF Transcript_23280/g.45194 Transcript_23280/m.45194 type:complete len:339 (+) Transcript_23280:328-1344(+)
MAPKGKEAPVLSAVELAQYTWGVVAGKTKPHDWASAQPIGPIVKMEDFLIEMVVITSALFVTCWVWEKVGFHLAYSLGLSKGKSERFSSSWVELIYYSMSLLLGYTVFGGESWLWPAGWADNMSDGRVQTIPKVVPYTLPADAKFAYLLETAWVVGGFLRLVSRKPKKDFNEMLFHHIVTYSLLMLSYQIGFCRIGAVVYLLHNTFDPFLHLAKCMHYLKCPIIPDISFVLCAIVFAATRLYYYPIAIWYAWIGVCPDPVINKLSAATLARCPGGPWGKTPVEFFELAALSALLPVHCMWFYMILRVMQKSVLSSGVQGDVRSDSEEEEEEVPAKKTK